MYGFALSLVCTCVACAMLNYDSGFFGCKWHSWYPNGDFSLTYGIRHPLITNKTSLAYVAPPSSAKSHLAHPLPAHTHTAFVRLTIGLHAAAALVFFSCHPFGIYYTALSPSQR